MQSTNLRSRTDRLKGQRDGHLRTVDSLRKETKQLTRRLGHVDRAREVIRAVASQMQEQLKIHVEEIGTLALDAIFPDDGIKLTVDFEPRRGKTECDIWIEDSDGNKMDPMDSDGGGAVDVVAFALRVSLWSLLRPRPRKVMVLDEPFRFLDSERLPLAAGMIREISERLGIQILMVTHSDELAETADRVLRVSQKSKVSKIHGPAELKVKDSTMP